MYRQRPNASWHEVDRALIAPPGQVAPSHPGVGMPHGLPPSLGFGALNPSIVTGNRFTGASVPGAMNLVHPEMPETFQAPSYSNPPPGRAIAPIVAALMATGTGGPTPPPRNPIGVGGGSIGGGLLAGGGATSMPGIGAPRAAGPGGGGGFQVQPHLTVPTGIRDPAQGSTLSALLAGLAQRGGRSGPSFRAV